ncbi:MAG: antibiotic biosynthesis monooxygenase family protein [Gaiellaceae bacterium]
MYSRVTLLEIDTLRTTIPAAVELFAERVLPRLREQEGYEGVVVLANPDGKAMLVSVWEDEEAANASAGFATVALEEFVTMFRSPPGREGYDVVLAEMPGVMV